MGYRDGEMAGRAWDQICGCGDGGVGIISRNPVAKCMVENCPFGKSWEEVFRSMVSGPGVWE